MLVAWNSSNPNEKDSPNMRLRMIIIGLAAAAVLLPLLARLLITTTDSPAPGGIQNGQLAPCPLTPNCVSSRPDAADRLPPIRYSDTPEQAMQRLVAAVRAEPRSTILTQTEDYLHVQFRSLVFGFGDDAEFLLVPTTNQIEFRSAARMGHSDLGVNRTRMERITQRMQQ